MIQTIATLNVPFCLVFEPFHFYLVMTLVVPCLLHNMFGFLTSELAKTGAMKPSFLDFGSPKGEGFVYAWVWFIIIV